MAETYIDERGYRRFKDSNKLVHRWAAEKKLGRKLRDNEVVHHKNANKLDNSPENLEVKTWSNHKFEHVVDALAFGGKVSYGRVNREKDSFGVEGPKADKVNKVINSNPLKNYNPFKFLGFSSGSNSSKQNSSKSFDPFKSIGFSNKGNSKKGYSGKSYDPYKSIGFSSGWGDSKKQYSNKSYDPFKSVGFSGGSSSKKYSSKNYDPFKSLGFSSGRSSKKTGGSYKRYGSSSRRSKKGKDSFGLF